jgi:hypothetical protein
MTFQRRAAGGIAAFALSGVSAPAATDAAPAPSGGDFGQYLVAHQNEVTPFFAHNADDLLRLSVPMLMSLTGWVIVCTMLLGWALAIPLGRGFSYLYSPETSDWKRAVIYATGQLFLRLLYTGLIALVIVVTLGLGNAILVIPLTFGILLLVSLAAQIVWVLYLFRTTFTQSLLFYLLVALADLVAGLILAQPVMGSHAPGSVAGFIDAAVTPRVQAETEATRHQVFDIKKARDATRAQVADSQARISQAEAEQERLGREIVEKKASDVYVLAQIIKARARGDLDTAREQLATFSGRFPASPLDTLAQTQLTDVTAQISARAAQQRQDEAAAERDAAAARADLLARAGRGEVTLSEMRQVLIGKSRPQVSDLLGPPTQTGPDQWNYAQQMILNPLTQEKRGLTVYFIQGSVQSVDYNHGQGGGVE